jgi:hypothetical protein
MPHDSVDRRPDTVFLGHVRRDRDAIPAGLGNDLRGLLARPSVDFGDDDLCAFRGHRARCRAADARPRPSNQRDLAIQPSHFKTPLPAQFPDHLIWRGSRLARDDQIDRREPDLLSKVERNAFPTPVEDKA